MEVNALTAGAEKKLQTLSLQPESEQAIDLKTLLEQGGISGVGEGAIVSRYTGQAHALQPVLFLESSSTSFALIPAFAAKHSEAGQGQTTWHFPFVPIPIGAANGATTTSGIISYALVINGTGQQIAAQIRSYAVIRDRSVQGNLNVPSLAPYETRLINLGTTQPPWLGMAASNQTSSTTSRASLNPSAITFASSGLPGDVAISIFTVGAAVSH